MGEGLMVKQERGRWAEKNMCNEWTKDSRISLTLSQHGRIFDSRREANERDSTTSISSRHPSSI